MELQSFCGAKEAISRWRHSLQKEKKSLPAIHLAGDYNLEIINKLKRLKAQTQIIQSINGKGFEWIVLKRGNTNEEYIFEKDSDYSSSSGQCSLKLLWGFISFQVRMTITLKQPNEPNAGGCGM